MEVVAALGVLTAAAFAAWYSSWPRRVRRRLRAASPTRIADLPDGHAGRLVGTAVATRPLLRAPLTGRPCIAYEVSVSERLGRPFIRQSSCAPFVLLDESGRALIQPAGSLISLALDHREVGSRGRLTPAQHAVCRDPLLMPAKATFAEGIVPPGGRVAVLGAGMREPDPDALPDAPYRGTQQLRLVMTSSRRLRLYVSNDPSTTS